MFYKLVYLNYYKKIKGQFLLVKTKVILFFEIRQKAL